MKNKESVTLWFGKEIEIDQVKRVVKLLHRKGFLVRSPFYIGYNISSDIVLNYLKSSLDYSDYLYVIGKEGTLLENILEYAKENKKPVLESDDMNLCLVS